MGVVTRLSVKDIQLAIRNSAYCDIRNDLIVPNVSWGLLPYEADLFVVKKSDLCIEFEIKRSFEDFKKDFEKNHKHDAQLVAYFYYVIPEKLIDKVKQYLIDHYGSSDYCPAVLYYNEEGYIKRVLREDNQPFGVEKRKGYVKASAHDRATLGRLVSIRYWNYSEEHCKTGFSKKDRKIRELSRSLKDASQRCKELQQMNGCDKWIKCSEMLPEDGRLVNVRYYSGNIDLAYYDVKKHQWIGKKGDDIPRWIVAWAEVPAYDY